MLRLTRGHGKQNVSRKFQEIYVACVHFAKQMLAAR